MLSVDTPAAAAAADANRLQSSSFPSSTSAAVSTAISENRFPLEVPGTRPATSRSRESSTSPVNHHHRPEDEEEDDISGSDREMTTVAAVTAAANKAVAALMEYRQRQQQQQQQQNNVSKITIQICSSEWDLEGPNRRRRLRWPFPPPDGANDNNVAVLWRRVSMSRNKVARIPRCSYATPRLWSGQ